VAAERRLVAQRLLDECLEQLRVLMMFEALAAGFLGSAEQAMTIAHRYLERTTAAGVGFARSWAQMVLATALTRYGDAEEAWRLGRAALAHQLPLGDQWGTTWVVHLRMWSLARLITDQIAAGNTSRSTLVELATEIAYLAGTNHHPFSLGRWADAESLASGIQRIPGAPTRWHRHSIDSAGTFLPRGWRPCQGRRNLRLLVRKSIIIRFDEHEIG
jgi:hypothetical protein